MHTKSVIPTMPKTVVKPSPTKAKKPDRQERFVMLKDVGEAYMDHFGLTDTDFKLMRDAGITHIESNFDICADDDDIAYFLNQSEKYSLKVFLPAGSGEAEWGYSCDTETFPKTKRPVWQKEKVVTFVNKWKYHPALYAWDISNEAGSVFPNASWENDTNNTVPDALYITTPQLQTVYRDVKMADPEHPRMIRMNGWFFYDNEDNFFRTGNPFGPESADIVMINAYSNVEDYYTDFVPTVMTRAIDAIMPISPNTRFLTSLGVWEEKPLWYLPTKNQLTQDLRSLRKIQQTEDIGISFFKYGAKDSEWYLPEDAPDLWDSIKNL